MAALQTFLAIAALIGLSYCQSYGDGSVTAEFEVLCTDTHFVVFFNKTALDERTVANYNNRSYVIRFYGQEGNTSCWTHDYESSKTANTYEGLTKTQTFPSIYLGVDFGGTQCGVNVFQDSTHIIYNTTIVITYGKNPAANIEREEYDKYNVMCLRNRTIYEKVNYNVEYRNTGQDASNSTADFPFTLAHTDMSNNVKSTYKLGDFIKFVLTSNTDRYEVLAVIQRCWATSDGSANEYALIQNRCTLEPGTAWLSAPTQTKHEFRVEAFRYLNVMGQAVHVECLVRVCLDKDSGAPECQLCPFSGRKRREVAAESQPVGQMALVKSPVFYIIDRDSTASNQESSSGVLSGTNGLIVIILLATLVFVIAAAIVKKVFFSAPAAPAAVTAYHNKAMA